MMTGRYREWRSRSLMQCQNGTVMAGRYLGGLVGLTVGLIPKGIHLNEPLP